MTVPPWKRLSDITLTKLQWSGQSRRCQRLDNLDTIVILLWRKPWWGPWLVHHFSSLLHNMSIYAGLCVNQATADFWPLNLTSEMTSKATNKQIGWRAATGGGPLPEHWDDVMKEKKPAKIRMTKNKQTLVEKSATLLHDWVDFSSIKALFLQIKERKARP